MISVDMVFIFCFGVCDIDVCLLILDFVVFIINVNMVVVGGVFLDGVYWFNDFSFLGIYLMIDFDGDDIYIIIFQ